MLKSQLNYKQTDDVSAENYTSVLTISSDKDYSSSD